MLRDGNRIISRSKFRALGPTGIAALLPTEAAC
jgi:hypothetical protein